MQRRYFLSSLAASAVTLLAPAVAHALPTNRKRFLRPPGALAEAVFLSRCIRCGQCSAICPNDAIRAFDFENGYSSLGTPYIVPREKACILCMKCGDVCPTGALQAIARDAEEIISKVKMGHARVDKSLCLSYQGKTCGVCYRACPLPDVSITVGRLEQPQVLADCVGCGLCERSCIQIPHAIRIIPRTTGSGPLSENSKAAET
ncbi:MAG: 4Fe-4S dicluster domain-containing protein [Gammaproteobacteria bacterium]|nr:4Fe-4S dicluster domain-containing protein [Gammaproteobacteria bacterium]